MMEVKYSICDEVVYLDPATCKFKKGIVKVAQIMPLGINKDESGKDVLDGYVVLYQLMEGDWHQESELFPDVDSARDWYLQNI